MQNRDAAKRDQHQRNESGCQHSILSAPLQYQAGQQLGGAKSAQDAEDAQDPRGATPAGDVDGGNRRQEIEPSPGHEIAPSVVRAQQTENKITEEQHAHGKVRVVEDSDRRGLHRTSGLETQESRGNTGREPA